MKTEKERIQQLLNNAWNGPMWHGANLEEILMDINAEKAFRKPIAGVHNIYELVMHMHCWRKFVYEHLSGNADFNVEINSTFDWPVQYETSEANWLEAQKLLAASQQQLADAFTKFDDAQLDEPMHGRKFSWYDFMHGLIHHDIYHSAQIAILKK